MSLSQAYKPYRFVRHMVGHFDLGGVANTAYSNEGDAWYFTLSTGIGTNSGTLIDSAPDITSTASTTGLPNYTEFQNLFDQFRVRALDIKFFPLRTETITGTTNSNACTMYYTIADQDDIATPTSLGQLLQHQDLHVRVLDKPFNIHFERPRNIGFGQVLGAGTQPALVASGDQWVNTSTASGGSSAIFVPGFKFWIDTGGAAAVVGRVGFVASVDLEFRAVV